MIRYLLYINTPIATMSCKNQKGRRNVSVFLLNSSEVPGKLHELLDSKNKTNIALFKENWTGPFGATPPKEWHERHHIPLDNSVNIFPIAIPDFLNGYCNNVYDADHFFDFKKMLELELFMIFDVFIISTSITYLVASALLSNSKYSSCLKFYDLHPYQNPINIKTEDIHFKNKIYKSGKVIVGDEVLILLYAKERAIQEKITRYNKTLFDFFFDKDVDGICSDIQEIIDSNIEEIFNKKKVYNHINLSYNGSDYNIFCSFYTRSMTIEQAVSKLLTYNCRKIGPPNPSYRNYCNLILYPTFRPVFEYNTVFGNIYNIYKNHTVWFSISTLSIVYNEGKTGPISKRQLQRSRIDSNKHTLMNLVHRRNCVFKSKYSQPGRFQPGNTPCNQRLNN